MRTHFLPKSAVDAPLGNHEVFKNTKARNNILPSILNRAGLQGFPYTRYCEIAAAMGPEEIHPDVIKTLDAVADHFDE